MWCLWMHVVAAHAFVLTWTWASPVCPYAVWSAGPRVKILKPQQLLRQAALYGGGSQLGPGMMQSEAAHTQSAATAAAAQDSGLGEGGKAVALSACVLCFVPLTAQWGGGQPLCALLLHCLRLPGSLAAAWQMADGCTALPLLKLTDLTYMQQLLIAPRRSSRSVTSAGWGTGAVG